MLNSAKPLILVVLDRNPQKTRRGPVAHLIQEAWYVDAVRALGGLPLGVDHFEDGDIPAILDRVHGIVLTGGDFDIDPRHFGETPHPKLGQLKPQRFEFERALYEAAKKREMPILGVCAGMQLMNVVEGGSLWQDLRSQHPSDIEHEQVATKTEPGHVVELQKDSLLHRIYGQGQIAVNTTHHQAVKDVASTCRVNAIAPDGLVEGIELKAHPFAVGVQWHPEAMIATSGMRLYRAFIEAAMVYEKHS